MNTMQKISQQILAEKRKAQLGLDPEADISHETLRQMWLRKRVERNLAALSHGPAHARKPWQAA